MLPSCCILLTDFRTVYVLALGPFLPDGHKRPNMAKYGHLAIGPYVTNMGKWGIPEKKSALYHHNHPQALIWAVAFKMLLGLEGCLRPTLNLRLLVPYCVFKHVRDIYKAIWAFSYLLILLILSFTILNAFGIFARSPKNRSEMWDVSCDMYLPDVL